MGRSDGPSIGHGPAGWVAPPRLVTYTQCLMLEALTALLILCVKKLHTARNPGVKSPGPRQWTRKHPQKIQMSEGRQLQSHSGEITAIETNWFLNPPFQTLRGKYSHRDQLVPEHSLPNTQGKIQPQRPTGS